jgi:Protein of unknown function (DUF4232)
MRTEKDLRAAFAAKAEEAPRAEAVRRAAARRHADRRGRRHWRLQMATLTTVVLVVAAGCFALIRYGNTNGEKSSSSGGGGAGYGGALTSSSASAKGNSVADAASGPVCRPAQLTLSLTWRRAATGLVGTVTAVNHGNAGCNLAVRPVVRPLSPAGTVLPVATADSAQQPAVPQGLFPGLRANATVTWPAWCGASAGQLAEIGWNGQFVQVRVTGAATTPTCGHGVGTRITSGLFTPLS